MVYKVYFAAETYNSDAYGSGSYQNVLSSGTGTPPSDSSLLANTGYDVIIPVALGIAVVCASAVFLAKTLRATKR